MSNYKTAWVPELGTYTVEVLSITDVVQKQSIPWNLLVLEGRHKGKEFPKWSNYSSAKGEKQLGIDLAKCSVKRSELESLVGATLLVEVREGSPGYGPSVIILSRIWPVVTTPRSQVIVDDNWGRPNGVPNSQFVDAIEELKGVGVETHVKEDVARAWREFQAGVGVAMERYKALKKAMVGFD